MISLQEAISLIVSHAESSSSENLSLSESTGRILAESVVADRDYPPFRRATMDGFAVRSNGFSADRIYAYKSEVSAGMSLELQPGEQAVRIMTGAPVPEGLNAVIKVEDSIEEKKGFVRFRLPSVKENLNIALKGEDLKKGEPVLPAGQKIDASTLSLLASLGKKSVQVSRLPKVHIVSTGNEVISVEEEPLPWQIRDSNSYTIRAGLFKFGILPQKTTLAGDEKSVLRESLTEGLDSDILILSGGVSMGNYDLVPSVLADLGVEQIFHKIMIKPGKPIWFGKKKSTVIFGLPGNPFSVQVCFRIFVEAYLRKFSGMPPERPLLLPLAGSRKKKNKLAEFFPAILDSSDQTKVSPKIFNGSGDVTAGLFSEGIALHPAEREELADGDPIEFHFW
ncbi:molybdopterin molybdenumtransferase MoeA [Leptospira fluminis]|uniref:Molybdopterin molybdenumtransferase n=1 Tax=Leptospira fluminis TaxID=2484979 RepID=A0A4R9GTP9_9LEPT|nr:molybdopterin molybdotransferase MoeA [Leptospira fluminis]TGK21000.1 molybdopterin molybdenumtransferase MoeA [Leptospira fluminis]